MQYPLQSTDQYINPDLVDAAQAEFRHQDLAPGPDHPTEGDDTPAAPVVPAAPTVTELAAAER